MSPEIEKLIDFALADGAISDKEREIIRNKAEKLGEDPDEAEMILDAKLAMKRNQAATPPPAASSPPPINLPPQASGPPPMAEMPPPQHKKSSKAGNRQSCPACGATVLAMELNCSECGHEFRDTGLSNLMEDFIEKLDRAERNALQEKSTGLLGKFMSMIDGETENERKIYNAKANVIKNFPIPPNKGDIIEFMTFSVSQANNITISRMIKLAGAQGTFGHTIVLKNAWISMADSIQSQAQFIDKGDEKLISKINTLSNQIDR